MNHLNKYTLEERTAVFGEQIIRFCKSRKVDTVTRPIVSQIVRSDTSIGANYMEANNASSRKDFQNKIFICKKRVSRDQALVKNAVYLLSRKRKRN